ncbi:hypothetical protein F5883DRAFT_562441 [Diaporthe sp. PMI_573]|nr:hypothetical protein F5883DRAFT_562441 [Diaporthaceae sp. PMI_573]
MDPFTALGVAAAALQFFDFSRSLLKEYKNQRGDIEALTQHSFQKATEDLLACTERMKKAAPSSKLGVEEWEEHEKSLQDLLVDCHELAKKLIDILHDLEPRASHGRWTSFSQAFKTIRKAEYIKDMRGQLDTLRNEMVMRVLASLNAKMDASLEAIEQRSKEITSVISLNHFETLEAILSLRDGEVKVFTQKQEPSESRPFGVTSMLCLEESTEDKTPRATLEANADWHYNTSRKILESLHFRYITDRYESVKKAHVRTLKWVFCDPAESERPWSDLPHWLENGRGCYWIRGKAGSGKSTLMKFLCQDEKTKKHLEEWAGSRSLTTASFFLWHLGFDIQKSQEGLLRALLYEVLAEDQWLMPRIMPDLFIEASKQEYGLKGFGSPSLSELMRWFKNLGSLLAHEETQSVCLFIDGIDEYSGDHMELLKLFLQLSKSTPNLKFVLSSRPTPDCVDALERCPSLRLEDLTRDDIREYTADMLLEKTEAIGNSPESANLIDEVASKSNGVFLWVVVVVRSLLEGLRNGDTLEELQERVEDMPSELGHLYRHMLMNIHPLYRAQASEMLRLLAANFDRHYGGRGNGYFRPFPALQFSFALENKMSILEDQGVKPLSGTQAAARVHQVEARVRSRSLGLIEISEGAPDDPLTVDFRHYHVDFIHRSVLEFLKDPEVAAIMESYTAGKAFNPRRALFMSLVSLIKSIKAQNRPSQSFNNKLSWTSFPWKDIEPAILLADNSEVSGSPIPAVLLDEFNKALCTHWQSLPISALRNLEPKMDESPQQDAYGHWFRLLLRMTTQTHPVPSLLTHEMPHQLWKMKRALQKAELKVTEMSTIFPVADQILCEKLLRTHNGLGFYYLTMVCPLPSYLESHLKSTSRGLRKVELTALLDFLVHNDAFLGHPFSGHGMFSDRAAKCFELLLEAGADPNEPSYTVPKEYSIWTLFLCTFLLWCQDRIAHHVEVDFTRDGLPQIERIVKAFISSGANVTATFEFGESPLTPTTAIRKVQELEVNRTVKDDILWGILGSILHLIQGGRHEAVPSRPPPAAAVIPPFSSPNSAEETKSPLPVKQFHAKRWSMSRSLGSIFKKRWDRR